MFSILIIIYEICFLQGFTVDNSPGNGNSGENCNNNIKMQMLGQNSNMNCVTGQINGIKMNSVQTLMYQHIPLSPAQQQTHQSCGLVDGQTEINSSHVSYYNINIYTYIYIWYLYICFEFS